MESTDNTGEQIINMISKPFPIQEDYQQEQFQEQQTPKVIIDKSDDSMEEIIELFHQQSADDVNHQNSLNQIGPLQHQNSLQVNHLDHQNSLKTQNVQRITSFQGHKLQFGQNKSKSTSKEDAQLLSPNKPQKLTIGLQHQQTLESGNEHKLSEMINEMHCTWNSNNVCLNPGTPLTGKEKEDRKVEITNMLLDDQSQFTCDQNNETQQQNKCQQILKKFQNGSAIESENESSISSNCFESQGTYEAKAESDIQRAPAKIWNKQQETNELDFSLLS